MNAQTKPVIAAWGYVAMGALFAAVHLPHSISEKKMMSLAVLGACGFLAFGCWSIAFGFSRLFMHADDRQKWFEEFSRHEDKIRGGSRRTVIILGCIGIITIFGSSSYFLWFY
jgi:hypothetical protein